MQILCLFLKISKQIMPSQKYKYVISYYVFIVTRITENYIALPVCKAPKHFPSILT